MVTSSSWLLFYLSARSIASPSPATPISAPGVLSQPSNDGVQIPNTSYSANVSDMALLPYKFHDPNTRTYLRLGFGFRRRSLDPMDMGALIAVAGDFVDQSIEEVGLQVVYPPTAAGLQEFVYEIGNGLKLRIWNSVLRQYWTWGTLRDVLDGLRLFLIVGERFRRTYFNFA